MNNQWTNYHAYLNGEREMNGRMTPRPKPPTRLELLRIKQASKHAADERTVLRGMLFVGLALVVVASIAMVMR